MAYLQAVVTLTMQIIDQDLSISVGPITMRRIEDLMMIDVESIHHLPKVVEIIPTEQETIVRGGDAALLSTM